MPGPKGNNKSTNDNRKTRTWRDDLRYLKKPKLVATKVENPIKEPVYNADPLYHFMRDVHDETVPKMWAFFLNEDRYSLGNEPIAIGDAAHPDNISMKTIAH